LSKTLLATFVPHLKLRSSDGLSFFNKWKVVADSHKKSTELNGTQICPSFCKLRFGTLTVPIQELPNLVELETAFHRASIGKAVGGDGIPPELCKYKARDLARLSYSIMLKTCLCSST
jgi:hypothetical protein